ncbi:hypothetical protein GF319_13440 [Candidatus Bathyarchaeota archaeon]|nr:hypothetical protein [Candidatus Bathyarchaeota archaeon]
MKLESANILKEKGIAYRIIELSDRAISVKDVIEYSKSEINAEEICKTIIVKDKNGRKYGIFLRGGDRVDFRKLKTILGKVSIASLEEVKKSTGVEPGAVCPLTIDMPVIVDNRVFENERLNFGSGDHLYGIEIRTEDLQKVIDFKVEDIADN